MTGNHDVTIDLTAEQVALVRRELLLLAPGHGDFEPTTREEITRAIDELQTFLGELDALGWDDEPTSLTLSAAKWQEIAHDLFTLAGGHMDGGCRVAPEIHLREASLHVPYAQLAALIVEHLSARESVTA